MRCSSIPISLILVASAALTVSACTADATLPGGAGATPPAMAAAGSGAGAAGTAAAAAGKTGAATSPATGAAGSGTATGTMTGAATTTTTTTTTTPAAGSAGSTGAATATAGSPASTGAAGSATGTAGSSAGAAGGGAAGPVTFTMVHEEVLTGAGCAAPTCHANASVTSKLPLADKADAYTALVGVMAMGSSGAGSMTGGCMGMPIMRVKAGDPAMSLLVQKLENKQTCGAQMPPGGSISTDKIQLIKDWITAGAKND